jgi:HAE1 family hydrophobic/amphiphilic exporter-1
MPLTLFSMFGLVALSGIVVNDSICLIDFINHRVRAGQPLRQSLLESGCLRFRPVLLTSVTTIGGLLPLLLETSFQAQFLVPMATSMAFGLIMTTALVLILVPVMYTFLAATADEGHAEEYAEGFGPGRAPVDEDVADREWLPDDMQPADTGEKSLSA